tara:strand:+ start:1209 stop:1586 length:378 start_codon:yes stop_codon:yes gene_type:complete
MVTEDGRILVLVLEDEPLIALDMEDNFRRAGFAVGSIISSCEDATVWLKSNTPDVVVLDVELRDGACTEIAKSLVAQNIPFVVHSGTPQTDDGLDLVFQGCAWIAKPSDQEELVAAVRACASTPA